MLTTKQDIEIAERQIKNCFNIMMQNIENIKYSQIKHAQSSIARRENAKLRKKFVDYLIKGLDFFDCIDLLSTEFYITDEISERVLRPEYEILKRKELSKKVYTAKTMCKAKFTTKQIAVTLHVSQATVRNYLKY